MCDKAFSKQAQSQYKHVATWQKCGEENDKEPRYIFTPLTPSTKQGSQNDQEKEAKTCKN